MIYGFRIVQTDGSITHHGIVSGVNDSGIFWAIDEWVDPWCVELKKLNKHYVGFCINTTDDVDDDDEPNADMGWFFCGNVMEMAESFKIALCETDGWYKPKWNKKDLY